MTTTKQKDTPPASSAAAPPMDLEAKKMAGLDEMTPKELAEFVQRQEQIELQRENNAILRAQFRMHENVDAPVAEWLRRTEEERAELVARSRSGRVAVEIPHTLLEFGSEVVVIRGTVVFHQTGDGPIKLTGICDWDFTEGDRVIWPALEREFGGQLEEARLVHDVAQQQNLEKLMHGKSRGLAGHRWMSITKPVLNKIISPKWSLDDLVAAGKIKLVGEIVWDQARPMINGKLPE